MDTQLLGCLLEAGWRALWPVGEGTRLEGWLIEGPDRSASYLAMGRRNLPFEVGNVGDGDPKSALGFVREFGERGYPNRVESKGIRRIRTGRADGIHRPTG